MIKQRKWRRRKAAAISLMTSVLLIIGGCGQEQNEAATGGLENSSDSVRESDTAGDGIPVSDSQEEQPKQPKELKGSWVLDEVNLPSPELSLSALKADDLKVISFQMNLTADGILWQEALTMDKNNTKQGHYIQKLEPPYDSWTMLSVPYTYGEGEKEYKAGFHYFQQGRLSFCELSDNSDHKDYLAGCDEAGSVEEVLGAFPESLQGSGDRVLAIGRAGKFYIYESGGNKLYCLNQNLEVEQEVSTFNQRKLQGVLTDAAEEKVYWYGTDSTGTGIFDLEGNLVAEAERAVYGWDPVLDMGGNGEVYMASARKLWRLKEKEWELLCDFDLQDYSWSTLYDIKAQEDGSVLVFGSLDGEDCLVRAVEGTLTEKKEKQEIIFAVHESGTGALSRSVSRFNRQSDRYHITLEPAQNGENAYEQCERIQMDIAAGKGPDILEHFVMRNLSGYIENGYLASLDSVIVDESQYLPAALEGGRTDGVRYGIPYDFCLHLATYSGDFTGGRTAWTLPELMEAVDASGAEILQYGCNGEDIVLKYGLYDNENTAYIDWEKGESHLTEEPFLKLLEFARKYQDTKARDTIMGGSVEEVEMVRSGKAFASYCYLYNNRKLKSIDETFEGKAAVLGYPRTSGNGIYAEVRYLYVSSTTACREGVEEYLRFLISEQEQSRYMMNESAGMGQMFLASYFPVNLNSFRKLEEYWQNTADISDKQIEQIEFMLERAKPNNWNVWNMWYIFSEELPSYFAGDKTAEQVAEILDSRVQIYLDERK